MNIPYVMRRCVVCKQWKVANSINFNRKKGGKYGLESRCNKCRKQYREANKEKIAEYNKEYREDNKEKLTEYHKQYYQDNKEMILEQHKQYYEANKDKMAEQSKQWYENNKEKMAEWNKQYGKRYRKENKEKIAEKNKRYREANREKLLEYQKQYCQNNKDKVAESKKRWREANKEKIAERRKRYRQTPQGQAAQFNEHNKRRQKEKAQGTGVTGDQWLEMMKYFDFRCAYTGERLTRKTKSIDHIVPIDAGGDDMVWNMVPMLRNLNSSKRAKDMLEWYRKQDFYSEARLAKIYEWQEYAYNKWGKDTEYFNTNDIQITLL